MKYIIELEDEPMKGTFEEDVNYYRCKQVPYWSLSEAMINKLTPYTNIDIKEKAEEFGRGYDAGWDEGSKFHEAEKESIEDEVWEFARKMISTSGNEVSEMWGCATNFGEVMHNTTYQEAKAKYEAWMKQKDEIHVGDEIYSDGDYENAVIMDIYGDGSVSVYTKSGCIEHWWNKMHNLKKTGRHFDEVEELLEKMRGEEE